MRGLFRVLQSTICRLRKRADRLFPSPANSLKLETIMQNFRLLREDAVREITGISHVALFEARKKKLFVNPVPITGRAVGYPDNEVQAIVRARIAGKNDQEIAALVESLHAARQQLA